MKHVSLTLTEIKRIREVLAIDGIELTLDQLLADRTRVEDFQEIKRLLGKMQGYCPLHPTTEDVYKFYCFMHRLGNKHYDVPPQKMAVYFKMFDLKSMRVSVRNKAS